MLLHRPASLVLLSASAALAFSRTGAPRGIPIAGAPIVRSGPPKAGLAAFGLPAGLKAVSLTTKVAPMLGAGLANSMFFSGLPEVLERRKEGKLGNFNPLPLPIIFGNCLGWLTYSLLTCDPFVAVANAPGLLLSGWYVMTAVQLAETSMARRIEKLSLVMGSIHVCAGLFAAFVLPSRAAMVALYGMVCNGILLAYYGAPLSTISTVLQEKSSASIYLPTVALNGLNAIFWSAYALAIKDLYIFIPNAIGCALAAVQAMLCVRFRPKVATA